MSSSSSRSIHSSGLGEDITIDVPTEKEFVMSTFAENTPHLPTSISKRSFMDDVYLEDGPLFRATIKQLEDRTATLKISLKRIIKSAAASLEVRRQLTRADNAYFDALHETQCIEPLMSHYLTQAWQTIQEERNKLDQSLSSHLLDPLKRCYDEDIKAAEVKRRQFEEESKEYYASLAKFLKTKKFESVVELQKKQNQKKCKFDLARFNYLAFLLDLHGGKKENEILFCITDNTIRDINYFETISTKIQATKPGLNELMTIMVENSREQEVLASERENKRKELVTMCNINNEMVVDQLQKQPLQDTTIPDQNTFKGIRDLEPTRDQSFMMGRKKEGFLFATSKPSKSSGFDVTSTSVTWHKYWCVLSNGKLHEYSNWKRHLETHIEPINLRFATVREARNADRRFCFEVITPQLRRIYQATSQEEAQSWTCTINNSIESVLKGTSSSANLFDLKPSRSSTLKRHGRSLSGAFKSGFATVTGNAPVLSAGIVPSPSQSTSAIKSRKSQSMLNTASSTPITSNTNSPVSGHMQTPSEGAELLVSASASPNERFRWSGFSFGSLHDKNSNASKQQQQAPLSTIQQNSINNGNYVFSSLPNSESNSRLLAILREDPSNHYCADCGTKDPDWCSLNLGVLLCIECSGIHRSLGTHISKIRSLTLDSTSYTPDIIELLKSVGNARSNVIWDGRFDTTANTKSSKKEDLPRPASTDSRSVKLAYIQAKYVGKNFVKKPTLENEQDVDQMLFEAIDDDNIPRALYSLALGANVNSSRHNYIKSPRISLFIDPQQQQRSSIQSYVPFLMNLDYDKDEATSKKCEITDSTESITEEKENYIVRFALHYALLHGRETSSDELLNIPLVIFSSTSTITNNTDTGGEGSSILSVSSESPAPLSGSKRQFNFPMAELLLQNGADTGIIDPKTGHTLADLVGMGSLVNDDAIAYISLKNTARGQSTITRSSTILNHHLMNLHTHEQLEGYQDGDSSNHNDTITEDIPPPLPPKEGNHASFA